MELGGNIELIGFDDLEMGHQIVAKKVIGNYIKKIAEKHKDYKSIKIELNSNSPFKAKGLLKIGKKEMEIEGEDKNMFQALVNCLENVL